MIFVRAGDYYLESKCQHYTVSKVSVNERFDYVAWFKAGAKVEAELLGIRDTAEQAQGVCESHFKRLALALTTQQSIARFMERERAQVK